MPSSDHDRQAYDALHALLESLGNATGVLLNLRRYLAALEARYVRLARRVMRVLALIAIGFVSALGVTYLEIRELEDATGRAKTEATRAESSSATARRLIAENRMLIEDLRRVARAAQVNGARADQSQCRQIERLKTQIRAVLRLSPKIDSPAGRESLRRFARTDCSKLPNAVPVGP